MLGKELRRERAVAIAGSPGCLPTFGFTGGSENNVLWLRHTVNGFL